MRAASGSARARTLYDRLGRAYGPLAGRWERIARRDGLAALAAEPGEQILEVGCGPGEALVLLARGVGSGGRIVGLDLSPTMCAVARRAVARSGPPAPVDVIEGDATALPLPDGDFDGCFMSFTLELFEPTERQAVLGECRRVLRPGGRLAVVGLSAEGSDTVMRRLYRRGHDRFPSVLDCRPIRVAVEMTDAGFEPVVSHPTRLWGLPIEVVVGWR